MSIRNVDRHGLDNLRHDEVKPLDRIKIPPFVLYLVVLCGFAYMGMMYLENEELQSETLSRRNLLKAMKKSQEQIEYKDNEISPAEELQMKSI